MNEKKEIGVMLSCMGYGYSVSAAVNGMDIGIKGGQSESMRLFGQDHPLKSEAPPDMQARLFILKNGENSLKLHFKKTGGEQDRLTFELYMEGQDEPFFSFVTTDAEGTVEKNFSL